MLKLPLILSVLTILEVSGICHVARCVMCRTGGKRSWPMGQELGPLASQADADDFLKEHKGKKILPFDRVSPDVPSSLDAGKF